MLRWKIKKTSTLLVGAMLSLAVCFFAVVQSENISSRYTSLPFRVPLTLEQGEVVEKTLSLDIPSENENGLTYFVSVECHRIADVEIMKEYFSRLVVSCFIKVDDKMIDIAYETESRGTSATRNTFSPLVAYFNAHPGQIDLKFIVEAAPVELLRADPHLIVEADYLRAPYFQRVVFMGAVLNIAMLLFVTLMVTWVGVLCFHPFFRSLKISN